MTTTSNNYKVPGKKMTSRFGYSHREERLMTKQFGYPPGEKPTLPMSKRQAKKCKHKHWVDDSYGGPESGCMAGHCRDCGFSFHHQLY